MKKKTLALLLAILVLTALLTGCGAVKNYSFTDGGAYRSQAAYEEYEEAAYEEDGYWAEPTAMESGALAAPVPAPDPGTGNQEGLQNPAKLIYTADLDMETLEFSKAVEALAALTAEVGGYFESSSLSDQGSYRWASYTVRVPADQYRTFLNRAGDGCHVLSQREYTEDVSETYYDTAGRLETQRTKLARLQDLLEEAKDMEDIIVLENAISETEETIDRLSGELRHYDALVDYSTVEIYLEEVKVYEPEPDPTFGSRLGAAFTDGLRGFAAGMGDLLVALAYSWLWLALIAAVVVILLLLTRKARAARREVRRQRKAQAEARRNQPAVYSVPSAAEAPEEKTEE